MDQPSMFVFSEKEKNISYILFLSLWVNMHLHMAVIKQNIRHSISSIKSMFLAKLTNVTTTSILFVFHSDCNYLLLSKRSSANIKSYITHHTLHIWYKYNLGG